MTTLPSTAAELARAFARGDVSAADIARSTLEKIARHNKTINAFTHVTQERALADAEAIDTRRSRGEPLPPLAGVPYAVKNLFDIAGVTTIAGSKILRDAPAASADSTLVERMQAAGAILVGALNMDEFAYGFTTENSHVGPTRNPHDLTRVAGGSSGGSAAAVAAGLVPITLGSDTNGSIRVPASLSGTFGLKPTFGRLSRHGTFPFVDSLDHLGPFASTTLDLALAYDACQSADARDSACMQRKTEPTVTVLDRDIKGLRIARLNGYFDEMATEPARSAAQRACEALGVNHETDFPHAALGRAAAFIVTAFEGGKLHLSHMRERYDDAEPLSRDRFISGALTPEAWYQKAQRVRRWYRTQALKLFERFDVLIAPATPCAAPAIGTEWLDINGVRVPARASMGLLTQPISCIGLPVVVAPMSTAGELPLGVQIIAAPWREDLCLQVAATLERVGAARSFLPTAFA